MDYTPPPRFYPGPNEYRAASGPVEVICRAMGGSGEGSVSYQWSSTCRACSFRTDTRRVVYRAAVHSGDTGIHTCTARRGEEFGSASIEFNVVGKC